jgi:GAF domain-containing protein
VTRLFSQLHRQTNRAHLIPIGKGVCGAAVAEGAKQIVGDVTKLDNYLACSVETRAEISCSYAGLEILGQIDIDSDLRTRSTKEMRRY